MTNRSILVTGAAGFIGSLLVEHLLDRGDRVIGLDNFDPFYSPVEKRTNLVNALANPGFRLIEVDCADLDALRIAVGPESVDVIVHLAAKTGVRPSLLDPLAYVRANIVGTQCVLELSRELAVGRIVLASSSSVYGESAARQFSETDPVNHPISPYAATKRACELLAYAYHAVQRQSVLALRFFTVYGPRQRPDLAVRTFATRMLRGQPVHVFGDGTSERDYTWSGDIITGVAAAIDRVITEPREFEIVNLGGSHPVRLDRLIELIANALGVEPVIHREPPRPGDVSRTSADIRKAQLLLGYQPSTSIEEGIPQFIDWLRKHERPVAPHDHR